MLFFLAFEKKKKNNNHIIQIKCIEIKKRVWVKSTQSVQIKLFFIKKGKTKNTTYTQINN